MKHTRHSQKSVDWEKVGFEVMAETRDLERAKETCGYKLQAFADEHSPAIAQNKSHIVDLQARIGALAAQLYQRHHPVSDTRMLAVSGLCVFLFVAFLVAFGASVIGNTMTITKFGWDVATCAVVGLVGTALVTVIGLLAHFKLFSRWPVLETAVVVLLSVLTVWALIDFGQGRGAMSQLGRDRPAQSFVDDAPVASGISSQQSEQTRESATNIRELFKSALTKLTIVADLAVGLLLGSLWMHYADPDYAGWRTLRSEKRQVARAEHELNQYLAAIEVAKKRCAAGITRALHFRNPNHPPYLVPMLLVAALAGTATPARAQADVKRLEVDMIDTSGSVGAKRLAQSVFPDYLIGAKRLLASEPASSRVWVQIITTDSFGSAPTLLKGWTPAQSGVFMDALETARHELVSSFQTKSKDLAPIAAGTDIMGSLWRAKVLVESEPNNGRLSKEIHIFSDMVNEVPGFAMPALLPLGTERMLEIAKAKGVIPLSGYRIYVHGASTGGLSPQAWNTVRAFWTRYFKECGATLVRYSSEISIDRE